MKLCCGSEVFPYNKLCDWAKFLSRGPRFTATHELDHDFCLFWEFFVLLEMKKYSSVRRFWLKRLGLTYSNDYNTVGRQLAFADGESSSMKKKRIRIIDKTNFDGLWVSECFMKPFFKKCFRKFHSKLVWKATGENKATVWSFEIPAKCFFKKITWVTTFPHRARP